MSATVENKIVIDRRSLRKIMVFYEDDTRQPTIISGHGMIREVNTTAENPPGNTYPVTYYEITMNPEKESENVKDVLESTHTG